MNAPVRMVLAVLTWPVATQQGSRRNAMVASTALAQRRRERDEVEAYLAVRAGSPCSTHEPQHPRRDVI